MRLGVMATLFAELPLDRMLERCAAAGLGAVELPVGAYPGAPFFDPEALVRSESQRDRLLDLVRDHRLEISALAVHGNPVHPDKKIATEHHKRFEVAVKLAKALGVDTVNTFSGCPGGSPRDTMPNWVTCAWPSEFATILRWQWDEVLVPYWAKQAKFAKDHGVRIAWEAHPGFCVYNPDTLMRLSERAQKEAGLRGKPVLGANFDPSHFFWQGIDPVIAARHLGTAGLIFHVHAKDTELMRDEGAVNGYCDARPYTDLMHRSWIFRTCGYGHGDDFWRPFISMLRRVGYDGAISIEHEDALMSVDEGFRKAVEYLKPIVIEEPPAEPWWV